MFLSSGGVWNQDAPWPKILSGVSLAEATRVGWRTRSLGDPGTIDIPSILPDQSSMEPPPPHDADGSSRVEIRLPEGFVHGQPYLPLAIPAVSDSDIWPLTNWLVVHFDLAYLTDSVFPRLLEKYSLPDNRVDFRFRLIPSGPAPKGTIASASQFHYRVDCFLTHSPGAGLSRRTFSRHEGAKMLMPSRLNSTPAKTSR
jgi:hypothetical protein